ncbi:MAG: ClpXP protease specificity-enhancing factor SspB [Pseudomonadota bacterium]
MSEDLIRYDVLAQEALRGVVKKILGEVSRTGLPGDHHFYISFATKHPGVRLSNRMRAQYPDEMTIVVQHQFWEMETGDTEFEIGLSFNDIPEKLKIPYAAIKGFFDPSVQFGLQFDVENDAVDDEEETVPSSITAISKDLAPTALAAVQETPEAVTPANSETADDVRDEESAEETDAESDSEEAATAEVVSLDAFRKKN